MIHQILTSARTLDRSALPGAVLLGVLILCNSGLEAIGVGLVFGLMNLIENPERISEIGILQDLYTYFDFTSEQEFITFAILFLFPIFALKAGLFLLVTWTKYSFTARNESMVSRKLFELYLECGYEEIAARNSAELITNIANRVFSVVQTTVMGAITILTDLMTVIAVSCVLILLEPMVTLGTAAFLAVAITISVAGLRVTLQRMGAQDVTYSENFLKVLKECLDSLKEIRISGSGKFFATKFGDIRLAQAALRRVLLTLQETPKIMIELMIVYVMLGVILFAQYRADNPGELLALLTLFGIAALRIMPATNRILFTINHIQSQSRNVEMVVSDFKNLEASRKAELADTEITFERMIELTDVTFSYPGKSLPTLYKINAEFLRGERIGIVGPSGAGKTSLVNLVMGLINPEKGSVSVDGVPISERLAAWRQRIGFVPQNIHLFDDTLRRNVAIGKKDEEIDDTRVSEALKQAQLDAVINTLPDGLETIVGEHGAKMSGGQIQRIGIARALYNDPDVLVLDEATAALDLATERDLNNALENLDGKTQIVIAHRLSTVRNCDRLFYMEDGRIAATGDFETLYQQNAAFRNLVDLLEIDNRVASE